MLATKARTNTFEKAVRASNIVNLLPGDHPT
jgi:hypothetical protein